MIIEVYRKIVLIRMIFYRLLTEVIFWLLWSLKRKTNIPQMNTDGHRLKNVYKVFIFVYLRSSAEKCCLHLTTTVLV